MWLCDYEAKWSPYPLAFRFPSLHPTTFLGSVFQTFQGVCFQNFQVCTITTRIHFQGVQNACQSLMSDCALFQACLNPQDMQTFMEVFTVPLANNTSAARKNSVTRQYKDIHGRVQPQQSKHTITHVTSDLANPTPLRLITATQSARRQWHCLDKQRNFNRLRRHLRQCRLLGCSQWSHQRRMFHASVAAPMALTLTIYEKLFEALQDHFLGCVEI